MAGEDVAAPGAHHHVEGAAVSAGGDLVGRAAAIHEVDLPVALVAQHPADFARRQPLVVPVVAAAVAPAGSVAVAEVDGEAARLRGNGGEGGEGDEARSNGF